MTRIQDLLLQERPRERLLASEPGNLNETELLAIIIGSGQTGRSALDLARELLREKTLAELSQRDTTFFLKQQGLGPASATRIAASFELGRRALGQNRNISRIRDADDIVQLFAHLMTAQQEEIHIALLDARGNLIKTILISKGTLSETTTEPRDTFRLAIEAGSAALVLVHNHPSGDPTPSEEDIRTTRTLAACGELLGIELLDHVIIGMNTHYSFRNEGIIPIEPQQQ